MCQRRKREVIQHIKVKTHYKCAAEAWDTVVMFKSSLASFLFGPCRSGCQGINIMQSRVQLTCFQRAVVFPVLELRQWLASLTNKPPPKNYPAPFYHHPPPHTHPRVLLSLSFSANKFQDLLLFRQEFDQVAFFQLCDLGREFLQDTISFVFFQFVLRRVYIKRLLPCVCGCNMRAALPIELTSCVALHGTFLRSFKCYE